MTDEIIRNLKEVVVSFETTTEDKTTFTYDVNKKVLVIDDFTDKMELKITSKDIKKLKSLFFHIEKEIK